MRVFLSTLCLLFATVPTAWANPFQRDIAGPGNEAYRAADYGKAVSEYLKAQDLEPLSAEIHFNLGSGYYRQDEYEEAAEEFTNATRADDPLMAASAFYNLGNARYKRAKRDFEAQAAASAGQEEGGNLVQEYVKKLEECIQDYEETLKRNPDNQDAKYNLEMIRREIKNLMRRQPQQPQPQPQQNQQQQNQEEQKDERQKQDQQQQQNQDRNGKNDEKATPTPEPMTEQGEATPTPQVGQQREESEAEPTGEPTQLPSISAEMARNILDNLPEQRQRMRNQERRQVEKDW